MRVSTFSTNYVWKISPSEKNWTRYDKNVNWSSCKVPSILNIFWWNFNFQDKFSKNTQILNFMKLRPVGQSCYMRTDERRGRRTDRHDEANSRFSLFCESARKLKAEMTSSTEKHHYRNTG